MPALGRTLVRILLEQDFFIRSAPRQSGEIAIAISIRGLKKMTSSMAIQLPL
jgi:hypothetical protein